jgi:hypothetical protein
MTDSEETESGPERHEPHKQAPKQAPKTRKRKRGRTGKKKSNPKPDPPPARSPSPGVASDDMDMDLDLGNDCPSPEKTPKARRRRPAQSPPVGDGLLHTVIKNMEEQKSRHDTVMLALSSKKQPEPSSLRTERPQGAANRHEGYRHLPDGLRVCHERAHARDSGQGTVPRRRVRLRPAAGGRCRGHNIDYPRPWCTCGPPYARDFHLVPLLRTQPRGYHATWPRQSHALTAPSAFDGSCWTILINDTLERPRVAVVGHASPRQSVANKAITIVCIYKFIPQPTTMVLSPALGLNAVPRAPAHYRPEIWTQNDRKPPK